ncbi:hypothetical protein M4951_19425 [Blastopirellula sp. J2-11]|uniref:hypothetical protein n=1 Tax=Blastopirellula sp. J2-11 TaxID=2943192 RepID=UPI0021CA2B7E|nr:hypothetical protein [Blastopirellula sp. J2-11]UUO05535.1 hypothetical protein M4951_19425 [Blastopirellula sp. J2-11]
MSPSSRQNETRQPELLVRHWPLVQSPWETGAMAIAFAAVGLIAYYASTNSSLGLLCTLLLLLTSWRMWLPAMFEIGPRGIVQKNLWGQRRIQWRNVESCQLQRKGVVIYLTSDASAAAELSNVYISGPSQVDEIREIIEFYLQIRRAGGGSSILRHDDSADSIDAPPVPTSRT